MYNNLYFLFTGIPRNFMNQYSTRVVVIILSFGTFFIVASYGSNLKAIFFVTKQKSRPESLTDALEDSDMQLICSEGTSLYSLLSSSNSSIYHEAWKRIEPYPQNVINLKDIVELGYERVENSKTSIGFFVQKGPASRYLASNPESNLYVAEQIISRNFAMMTYRKGFVFADIFNREIERLKETGNTISYFMRHLFQG